MKIAVDARPLTSDLTGIGRYTYNVLKNLLIMAPEHEWFLYAHKPLIHSLPNTANLHIRTGKIRSSLLSTSFAQIMYPVWACKDNIDIFWSPRHHLPIFLPRTIRKIVTIHDIVWKRHPETMSPFGRIIEMLLMPYALRHSDKIISISEFTKNELIDAFDIPDSKITVTKLAPYEFSGTPALLPKKLTSKPYFLFVGTLEPRKNLLNLLRAFKHFNTKHSHQLVIAGGKGWGSLSINKTITDLELSDSVFVYGYVDDNLLHALYKNCTALLMPSIYEGFGLSAIEALQFNKPVVATKKSAIPELNSPLAILIDNESTDSIYTAIQGIERIIHTTSALHNISTWRDVAKETMDIILH